MHLVPGNLPASVPPLRDISDTAVEPTSPHAFHNHPSTASVTSITNTASPGPRGLGSVRGVFGVDCEYFVLRTKVLVHHGCLSWLSVAVQSAPPFHPWTLLDPLPWHLAGNLGRPPMQ